MKPHLSKAYSQYGADMGRPNNRTEPSYPVRFHVQRIRLNSGGYDSGGAYWGQGQALYYAWGDGAEEVQEHWTRATDRDDAKTAVLNRWPNATFYR